MPIQLIDFGQPVRYIDVDASKVPYTFTVRLEDRSYQFTIRYNDAGGFYTIDLATLDGELLCGGDPVRYGRPLFGVAEDERFPLPVIIPQCLTGEEIDTVTPDNFGSAVKLYLHERRVE